MNKQNFDINKLRVASPCPVGWETMTGDERVRRCHSCELNIYNVAEMTKSEVEDLITKREDRVCIRLYKRADGTVLTKDCPVGLRAYQKRVARFAGTALAAILGLFSVSFGQKEDKKSIDASKVKIVRTVNQNQESTFYGTIQDVNGAVIPEAKIKLYKSGNKKPFKTESNDEGTYIFRFLSSGIYELEVKFDGFTTKKIVEIEIKKDESIILDVSLEPAAINVTVGIIVKDPLIDSTSSSLKTTIGRERIDKLPY